MQGNGQGRSANAGRQIYIPSSDIVLDLEHARAPQTIADSVQSTELSSSYAVLFPADSRKGHSFRCISRESRSPTALHSAVAGLQYAISIPYQPACANPNQGIISVEKIYVDPGQETI